MIHYFVSYVRTDRLLDMSNYQTTTIKVDESINKANVLEEIEFQLYQLGKKPYPMENYKIIFVSKL